MCASALTLNPFPLVCIDSNYLNHFFFPLNYSSLSTFNTFFFLSQSFFETWSQFFSKLGAVIRKKEECCSVDLCFSLCFFKQSFISSALCSSLCNQKRPYNGPGGPVYLEQWHIISMLSNEFVYYERGCCLGGYSGYFG